MVRAPSEAWNGRLPLKLFWDGGETREKSPGAEMEHALWSCPGAAECTVQIRCFNHIVSREFLRNKGDSPLR